MYILTFGLDEDFVEYIYNIFEYITFLCLSWRHGRAVVDVFAGHFKTPFHRQGFQLQALLWVSAFPYSLLLIYLHVHVKLSLSFTFHFGEVKQ